MSKSIGNHRVDVYIKGDLSPEKDKYINIPNDVEVTIVTLNYCAEIDFIAHSEAGHQFLRFATEKEKQTLVFYALYRELEANTFLPGEQG